MAYILAFLLIVFIIYLLAPYLLQWLVRRQMRKFQDRARQAASASGAGRKDNRGATTDFFSDFMSAFGFGTQPQRPRRRKKIPDDVGEYVKFTEIDVKQQYSTSGTDYTREEQVSDAEWEDLK